MGNVYIYIERERERKRREKHQQFLWLLKNYTLYQPSTYKIDENRKINNDHLGMVIVKPTKIVMWGCFIIGFATL